MSDYAGELQQAVTQHQTGDFAIARASYESLLARYGQQPDPLHLIGLIEYQTGNPAAAIDWIRRAVALQPQSALFLANLGEAYRSVGRLAEAEQHLRQTLELDGNSAAALNSLGATLRAQRRWQEAASFYRRALAIDPGLAEAHANLGLVLRELGQHNEALRHARQAVAMKPGNAVAQNNLANLLKDEGRFDEALASYRRALELNSAYGQAWSNLASARRFDDPTDDDIVAMQQVLAQNGLTENDRSHLHFALGKALDDCGRWDEAFQYFVAANELVPRTFDAEACQRYVDEIIATFDAGFFAAHASQGCESHQPIFIVGMPRSGTSLIEQVLASHSQADGLGESTAIPQVLHELPSLLGVEVAYPSCCQNLTRAAIARAADSYLAVTDACAGGAPRTVDKMMTNFLHLGLIVTLFPRAKVIHCRRDARDVCLSCYFQDFSQRPEHMFDLRDLAFYYRQYARLMRHWKTCLPIEVFEVTYESFIADHESHTRAILSHCELDWEDACLNYKSSKRIVRTASNYQVRQLLQIRSVARWKHYRAHLRSLLEALGDEAPLD